MIRKITDYMFVGSDADLATLKTTPAIVHAAKEPWHRKFVGYTTPGAPKDHHEYLWAVRFDEMAMNLVDVDNPLYVPFVLMDKAVNFINYYRTRMKNVFIHCNQGLSRGPTVAMLAYAPSLAPDFMQACVQFQELYPDWIPKRGVYEFARENWRYFHADK